MFSSMSITYSSHFDYPLESPAMIHRPGGKPERLISLYQLWSSIHVKLRHHNPTAFLSTSPLSPHCHPSPSFQPTLPSFQPPLHLLWTVTDCDRQAGQGVTGRIPLTSPYSGITPAFSHLPSIIQHYWLILSKLVGSLLAISDNHWHTYGSETYMLFSLPFLSSDTCTNWSVAHVMQCLPSDYT